ncbi:MAG: Ig-like domain repeat protein [Bacilli bacterium]|nr:Ig-like domain repeat protein [Bacilli bacterium]
MRNQNYITNKKIIAEVKKNQKDYVEPKPPKKDLTLTATVEPITVGENATINVTGLEEATGNITAIIGEKNYTGAIDKGNATITVPDLTKGNFTANISYAGDDKYNPASATVDITVNSGTTGGGVNEATGGGEGAQGDNGLDDDDEGPTVNGPTMDEEEGEL